MKKIFIDTNIIISYTKGYAQYLEILFKEQKDRNVELFVNAIVVAEFFTDQGLKNRKSFQIAKELFHNFSTIEINKHVGIIAGELMRNNLTVAIGDSLIAATCLKNDLELLTNNQKDFKKVKGLKFFDLDNKKY